MKNLQWNETTTYEDIPKVYRRLMPSTTNLDALDSLSQMDHIRFRVQHEIDIADEEGLEETGMSRREYANGKRFLRLTFRDK